MSMLYSITIATQNIKKIIDTCKRGVVLRLRGQGSGFLEGPAKVEVST
jgi:hypothetical protein